MPYESTRVCLQPIRGVEGSDYINASFIDGYRYLALAQRPSLSPRGLHSCWGDKAGQTLPALCSHSRGLLQFVFN